MKIKVVENGGFIYLAQEENILASIIYNLVQIKNPLNKRYFGYVGSSSIKRLVGIIQDKYQFSHIKGDTVRNLTLEEYLYLSQKFREHGLRYNKKKNVGIEK